MSSNFGSEFNFVEYFTKSATFLSNYCWVFEQSNTKFVQTGVLDRIPADWLADLESCSNEDFNKIPLGFISDSWSDSLKQFFNDCLNLSVIYDKFDAGDEKRASLKGVGPKKLHEISNLTALISKVCLADEILLDFGSGLGYLSQHLNQKHNFTVLGLEGDAYRVQASVQRQQQLFADSSNRVKFVQHFIETDSFEFIQSTINEKFGSSIDRNCAIIGLHACADLTVTAIKIFLSHKSITKLVIMPCCYHKLKPDNVECTMFTNIPISEALRNVLAQVPNFLGRPFLRLGCQQTSARWINLTEQEHQSHGRAMFERSLVEAILDQGETVAASKASRGSGNVLERFLVRRDGDDGCWSEEHRKRLQTLMEKYPNGGKLAEYLTCLQTCLQSLCENLILLDRMCYLKEEATKRNITVRSNLVKFNNDHLSPRCFVIVADKLPER